MKSRILNLILTFLPWAVLNLALKYFPLNYAISIAFLTSFFLFKGLKSGIMLDWGTFLFFIFSFVLVVVFKNMWFAKRMEIFAFSTLDFIAWFSIMVRRPFTQDYARLQVPKEKWKNPLFLRINFIMTLCYAMAFLLLTFLSIFKFYYPSVIKDSSFFWIFLIA